MSLDFIQESKYEERADYLTDTELDSWNVEIDHFAQIQNKLIEKGSKVIIGPRGCGKTHQMRIAYNSCINNDSKPLPIYVSFSRYYFLEPLLSKNSEAIIVFHTWVLSLIILACNESCKNINGSDLILLDNYLTLDKLELFISQAEKGIVESWHQNIINNITLPRVMNIIDRTIKNMKRKRAILLMDDAALTLTKEYMIEFFDIFRTLKSKTISPKASVYPGTTEYGPRFHLNQDGDPFNVWFNPLHNDFMEFTNKLLEKRFTDYSISEPILSLLKYASFGNPRAFITLLRDYSENKSSTVQGRFNSVLQTRCKLLRDEYLSIKQKLLQYSTIIDVGMRFFDGIIQEIVSANNENIKNKSENKKLIIGLAENDNSTYKRMIAFLIEAGLLYGLENVKHGEDRVYNRYIPHMCFLLEKRAFSVGRGFNTSDVINYLKLKDSKHPVRKDNLNSIINDDIENLLKLDLPVCSNCGTSRLTENQKFCHSCGMELVTKSTFELCMDIEVNELPLTDWQKQKILKETTIRTVKDFLNNANIGEELRKPYGIGFKRAAHIANNVNIWIEEFLV